MMYERDCDKETGPSPCCDQPMSQACRELTFREVLERKIDDKEKELAGLKALMEYLPMKLPHYADAAVRRLLLNADPLTRFA